MIVTGRVEGWRDGRLTASAPFPAPEILQRQDIRFCEIRLIDGRSISPDQRRKIYATLRDISDWTGYTPEETKAILKYDYIASEGVPYFSLSDVDMTTANGFLSHLIDFCIRHEVPTYDTPLLDRAPDVYRYLYSCLANKRCCITGRPAELHHVDAVGAGRDREEIIHLGMRVLPLTREMHTKAHQIGRESFCTQYHVFGIELDADLCKIWGVKDE